MTAALRKTDTAMPIITRSAAMERGLRTYFTGLPSKHGHVAGRRASNRDCLRCSRPTARRWHAANKEKSNARAKALMPDLVRLKI